MSDAESPPSARTAVWFSSRSCRLNVRLALCCSLMVCWNQTFSWCLILWSVQLFQNAINKQICLSEDNTFKCLTDHQNGPIHASSAVSLTAAQLITTDNFCWPEINLLSCSFSVKILLLAQFLSNHMFQTLQWSTFISPFHWLQQLKHVHQWV